MKKRINKSEISNLLYNNFISYFEYGIVRRGKESYTYFKTDKLTDTQRTALNSLFVDVLILGSHSQYAPEKLYNLICFKRGVKTFINSELVA